MKYRSLDGAYHSPGIVLKQNVEARFPFKKLHRLLTKCREQWKTNLQELQSHGQAGQATPLEQLTLAKRMTRREWLSKKHGWGFPYVQPPNGQINSEQFQEYDLLRRIEITQGARHYVNGRWGKNFREMEECEQAVREEAEQ